MTRLLLSAGLCVRLLAAGLYVSPNGDDRAAGDLRHPLRTFAAAQQKARALKTRGPLTIWFRGGTYYLPDTIVFTPADSGSPSAPIAYRAYRDETPVLSGGIPLSLKWSPYRDGIMQAEVPASLRTGQLFVNGERQHMARYPNYDPAQAYFDGWAADAFSPARAARWSDPRGGFMHAMHKHLWGDFHYVITGKDAQGNLQYEGGWQNNRQLGMHDKYRFVENIFEELDAPGEWYLNEKTHTLYFYPPAGLDLAHATVEAVRLSELIAFRGSASAPVEWITLSGFTLRHAARTFMSTREPLLRSDWTIYRGGAVMLTGCRDCVLENCFLDQLGGNAIFINHYNRRVTIRGCHIANAGASGVSFVGDPKAVRNPLFDFGHPNQYAAIDKTPGPIGDNYPADCLLDDSLIYRTGRFEKQTAPVQISMAQSITVRHCSLYDVPRAGINISEGTWGGHVIEYCDVFDTVKETGDHGSFNSWGRDRWWNLQGIDLNALAGKDRDLPRLDAVKTTTIRNNRWRCDHGWDIDLDDGSSNYYIANNLCLRGGLKLREGFGRTVENNIMVANSFHPHVWFKGSGDIFRRNIVFAPYRPIRVPSPWGAEVDYNLLHVPALAASTPARKLQEQSGRDEHSLAANARFVNAAHGGFHVANDSPALSLGFRNFAMDEFGVVSPRLKALARTPAIGGAAPAATMTSKRDTTPVKWLGATVRNVAGLGEVSAAGLAGEMGVIVLEVPAGSRAAIAGVQAGDVIVDLDYAPLDTTRGLNEQARTATVIRGQNPVSLTLNR